ncbi:hypothetical protein PC116_g7293 [Phytophthora cactorum]|nr:hypothetical protein PC114_g167 [Phytophthora cactorum]KAG3026440.1 hypothetical protein PC119_g7819 [Phytophthora cactorum]KAG4244891.1 hypothetical protein PC116_g7293 [Phytophthora cactorum]
MTSSSLLAPTSSPSPSLPPAACVRRFHFFPDRDAGGLSRRAAL